VRRFADALLGIALNPWQVQPLTTALSLLTSRNASSNPLGDKLISRCDRGQARVQRRLETREKTIRRLPAIIILGCNPHGAVVPSNQG
jgi:hypothetical protein